MVNGTRDTDGRSHPLRFPTAEGRPLVAPALYWIAIAVMCLAANAPPRRLRHVAAKILQWSGFEAQDLEAAAQRLADDVLIPLKGVAFLLALIVVAWPILRETIGARAFWRAVGIRRMALWALAFFAALSLFVVPYPRLNLPVGHPSGLIFVGELYGAMSEAPFSEPNDWVFRRLLKPALSYFLLLRGHQAYYVFSLICNYALVFMCLAFLESRVGSYPLRPRLLIYLSAMTSCFMLVNFQWPGYPDQITFTLILLGACIPMTSQARLGILALALINIEASIFALLPIVLFCFPRAEILRACLVPVLYYVVLFGGYGFDVAKALGRHGVVLENEASISQYLVDHPSRVLAGLFFSHKLLWVVFLYVVWQLWRRRDRLTSIGIACIVLGPLPAVLIAWDTSRLASYGFFGMLVALTICMSPWNGHRPRRVLALDVTMAINLLIPSYNIILLWDWTVYRYPGIYHLIHRFASPFG